MLCFIRPVLGAVWRLHSAAAVRALRLAQALAVCNGCAVLQPAATTSLNVAASLASAGTELPLVLGRMARQGTEPASLEPTGWHMLRNASTMRNLCAIQGCAIGAGVRR